jgi:hypothetical protein
MALFDGPTLEVDDTRCDHGERRIIAYGAIAGQVLVCVYTGRGSCQRGVHLEGLDGLFGGLCRGGGARPSMGSIGDADDIGLEARIVSRSVDRVGRGKILGRYANNPYYRSSLVCLGS